MSTVIFGISTHWRRIPSCHILTLMLQGLNPTELRLSFDWDGKVLTLLHPANVDDVGSDYVKEFSLQVDCPADGVLADMEAVLGDDEMSVIIPTAAGRGLSLSIALESEKCRMSNSTKVDVGPVAFSLSIHWKTGEDFYLMNMKQNGMKQNGMKPEDVSVDGDGNLLTIHHPADDNDATCPKLTLKVQCPADAALGMMIRTDKFTVFIPTTGGVVRVKEALNETICADALDKMIDMENRRDSQQLLLEEYVMEMENYGSTPELEKKVSDASECLDSIKEEMDDMVGIVKAQDLDAYYVAKLEHVWMYEKHFGRALPIKLASSVLQDEDAAKMILSHVKKQGLPLVSSEGAGGGAGGAASGEGTGACSGGDCADARSCGDGAEARSCGDGADAQIGGDADADSRFGVDE